MTVMTLDEEARELQEADLKKVKNVAKILDARLSSSSFTETSEHVNSLPISMERSKPQQTPRLAFFTSLRSQGLCTLYSTSLYITLCNR